MVSKITKKVASFVEEIIESLEVQQKENIHITNSVGRVLAEDVSAKFTMPNKDTAAVDGYAVILSAISQIPVTLSVVGESRSNKPFNKTIVNTEAVKVFAGAIVPEGADTILPKHMVEEYEGGIIINEQFLHGENICYKGIDFAEGKNVLRKGRILSPCDIGLAAAMRASWLPVRRKPKVAVLAIGDELIMPGDGCGNDKTVSSSSISLCAFLQECGAEALNMGIAPDSKDLSNRLKEAANSADLLVTTGGLSASADNLMRKILTSKNNKAKEIKISLGKEETVMFGNKNKTSLLALPANPISAHICANIFLRPAVEKMLGIEKINYRVSTALLSRNLDVNDIKVDFIFSRLMEGEDNIMVADPASSQDRLLLSSLANADCMIVVDKDNCKKDAVAEIILL